MASGVINGSVTGSSADKYRFWVEWNSTPDTSSGTSYVRVKAYLQRTDGYASSAWNNDVSASQKTLVVDGTTYHPSNNGIDTRNSQKVIIASAEKTIAHNSDGYKTINISASFPRVASSLTGGSLSGSASLGHIDVSAPNISVTVVSTTTSSVRLHVTSDAYLSSIQCRVTGLVGWYSVGSGTDLTFDVTNLSANQSYSIAIRGTKQSNGKSKDVWLTAKTSITSITGISLQDDTLSVGQRKSYTPTITPSGASVKSLTYQSSNPSVAALQSGTGTSYTVLARGVGTTTIIATATDGSGCKGTCTITVTQPVTGIQAATDNIAIPVGGSAQIAYTILPANATNKGVTIDSSDTSIASVSGATVVGVANGVTTITITTLDGGYTATVQITVQGSFVWYDYPEPIEILNAVDVQHIDADMSVLRGLIMLTGASVGDFDAVDARVNTPYRSMRGMLQAVENNLTALNNTPYKSGYYGDHVTVGEYATDRAGIWRWLLIINDIYHILAGDVPMWQALLCADGYPTIDGNRVLVRGEIYIFWQTLLCTDGYPTINGNHINIRGDLVG